MFVVICFADVYKECLFSHKPILCYNIMADRILEWSLSINIVIYFDTPSIYILTVINFSVEITFVRLHVCKVRFPQIKR